MMSQQNGGDVGAIRGGGERKRERDGGQDE